MKKKISYIEFQELLSYKQWHLKISIKENKLPDWHLIYLDNLHRWNPDMIIDIWIDSLTLHLARKIDIFVKHKDQNPNESGVKHLQFVSF